MSVNRNRFKSDYYIDGVRLGDRIVLSKAITIIESQLFQDEELAAEILNGVLPFTGNSIRIGLTGAPGVGKSTFIESFGKLIIEEGKNVAVLTIDPSSSLTRGSILGDKTRMTELSKNKHAFIRPSPAGNTLGGTSAKTREVMLLCEAAGYDTIIVETVGVGQSETLVKGMVDFFLLLMLAGSGDELQGIKKGIIEMANLILITKADGENLVRVQKAKNEYQGALEVLTQYDKVSKPKVLVCSAATNYNIDKAWLEIKSYVEKSVEVGQFKENRRLQNLDWLHHIIKLKLENAFYNSNSIKEMIKQIESEVLNEKVAPLYAANLLLKKYSSFTNN